MGQSPCHCLDLSISRVPLTFLVLRAVPRGETHVCPYPTQNVQAAKGQNDSDGSDRILCMVRAPRMPLAPA
jgi:hypothetical protein